MRRLLTALFGSLLLVACSREPANTPAPTIQASLAWDELGISDFRPTADQRRYDVERYGFELAIEPVTCAVVGRATIEGRKDAELEFIELDLHDSMRVERTDAKRVGRDKIRVTVPVGSPRFAIQVRFEGEPRRVLSDSGWTNGLRFDRVRDHPVINTCFQPFFARFLWPCKDHPSDKAERGVAMAITVPEPLNVVATGRRIRIELLDDGRRTHHWSTDRAIATNVMSFAVAPYTEIEGSHTSVAKREIPLRYFVLPDSVTAARRAFAEVTYVLNAYEARFGPYPFADDKFALVETSYSALENQTAIAYGSGFPTSRAPGEYDYALVHETAHEWFGNSVTCADWRDVWLHEGLATFAESLYVEARDGTAHARSVVRDWHERASDDALTARDVQSDEDIFRSPVIYTRAASVVRMLRWVVGDSAFFAGLRDYLSTHAGGNATTDDFRRALERHATLDLGDFFGAWVHGRGRLAIEWSATRFPGGVEVRLRSTSIARTPHRLPVQVRLEGLPDRRIEVGPAWRTTRFEWAAGRDWTVRLDPDAWLLLARDQRRVIRGR